MRAIGAYVAVVPVVVVPLATAIALDVVAWILFSLGVGYVMARRPEAAFGADGPVLRLRRFERGGRADWYERRLGIGRWKDALPEAGAMFGELSKRTLPPGTTTTERLERFAAETRRAERTHWVVLCCGPLLLLWNPLWLAVANCALATTFNLPCIAVQRSNRARIGRVLERQRGRRPA
jgi:glycosyl-4,4'-diaponeurosporenoate acyltransferase